MEHTQLFAVKNSIFLKWPFIKDYLLSTVPGICSASIDMDDGSSILTIKSKTSVENLIIALLREKGIVVRYISSLV